MKILIGGDYVPRENIAKMMESGNFSYFNEIKPLTENADYSIINLEAPIVNSIAKPIEKCGPNLRTSRQVVKSLQFAGIDMVTLANNHIMDFGDEGLNDTLKELNKGQIKHVGVGENLESARKIEYIKVGDKTLAIINCCEHEFSIATTNKSGANPLNPVSLYYSIQEAKRNSDYILVIIHGGHEHWQLPSPRMVESYRFFIDTGADAVVNHHQHCYSGYEVYRDKPIFYGLGNLCFEYATKTNSLWNYGYMVTIEFDDQIKFKIHPYRQCNGDSTISLLSSDAFKDRINELNEIIVNPTKLNEETETYYSSCRQQIHSVFNPYSGRIASKLFSMKLLPSFIKGTKRQQLINFINCESHRDKVSFNL
ncbi:MAG: CapA family protein [Clostridiales bacterium]|nr:CapA family protein [Clostridiales bacterium]